MRVVKTVFVEVDPRSENSEQELGDFVYREAAQMGGQLVNASFVPHETRIESDRLVVTRYLVVITIDNAGSVY